MNPNGGLQVVRAISGGATTYGIGDATVDTPYSGGDGFWVPRHHPEHGEVTNGGVGHSGILVVLVLSCDWLCRVTVANNCGSNHLCIGGNEFCIPRRLQQFGTPHRLTHQRGGDMGSHQPLKRIRRVKLRIQPQIKLLRPKHQRNAFRVDVAEPRVRRQCDDGEGIHLLLPEVPGLP